jgi:hypothetical protein
MKAANRDDKGGGKKWNYKDKRQQRLGGKNGGLSLSLSLSTFSKAKFMPSSFNPSLISKHFFSQKYIYVTPPLVLLVIEIIYLLSGAF